MAAGEGKAAAIGTRPTPRSAASSSGIPVIVPLPAIVGARGHGPLRARSTEWARTGGPVMVRTGHGPELVDDPWAPA
ncbi:hypothetical protein [Nonomuraea africana]|uniref:Uncharacterized protein n=1 Tax=Nonomuraea africana TaxID=46171 RepID=A0ABR9KNM0_9ACTN|nr:hypothetical protein [Nonomuraea africana]MBE1563620.1 hypothetical protein [Nonomuraea africana]